MDIRTERFMKTERGIALHATLTSMARSKHYKTETSYSPGYKNGQSFVMKQMAYMSQYPDLNYNQYVSNLKLKTRIKT